MKKGFTLAETLITFAIIGIIAAIVMPLAAKSKPDSIKVTYLKAYDTMTNLIKGLASDTRIYPICRTTDNAYCGDYPLMNTDKPSDKRFNDDKYSGSRKLCELVAYSFGLEDSDCSADGLEAALIQDYPNNFDDKISFVSSNGMQWEILTSVVSPGSGIGYYGVMYVDVNGPKSPNCFYSDDCKNPDRFKFFVYADGGVEPADPMGRWYVSTRTSLTKSNQELEDTAYPVRDGSRSMFAFTSCN